MADVAAATSVTRKKGLDAGVWFAVPANQTPNEYAAENADSVGFPAPVREVDLFEPDPETGVGELLIRRLFRMPPTLAFEPLGLVLWLLLSLALGALASVAPAWHASRREVREAISYE